MFTWLLPGKTSTGGTREGRSNRLTEVVADIKFVLNKFALSSKLLRIYKSVHNKLFKDETPIRPVLLPVFDVLTRCAAVMHAMRPRGNAEVCMLL